MNEYLIKNKVKSCFDESKRIHLRSFSLKFDFLKSFLAEEFIMNKMWEKLKNEKSSGSYSTGVKNADFTRKKCTERCTFCKILNFFKKIEKCVFFIFLKSENVNF